MSPNRLTADRQRSDLLVRPPTLVRGRRPPVPDPLDQLKALADLHWRGLLSHEEFEQQKARVLSL